MVEEILTAAVRVASGAGLGVVWTLGLILAAAVLLVILKKAGGLSWKPPPAAPDLVEHPPSPPIVVRPDGSIPVSNPVTPPAPGPM